MDEAVVILKVLAIFLVISRVDGQCALSNIDVNQYDTGRPYQGYSEYAVTIFNRCPPLCYQSNVKLNCTGFKTVRSIDPSILKVIGDVCLVKNGQPIAPTPDETVRFTYAWANSFSLNPISSEIHCH